jgi:hypothetical protein
MNKKFLIPMIAVFGIAGVFAIAYVVSTLTLTVGVAEPFTVEYAFLGDAGTYTTQTCDSATNWIPSQTSSIPTGNMFAGESRYVCIRITNLAEAILPYTITSSVENDNANNDCANAFGLPREITGTVDANAVKTDGSLVAVSANATPVQGCNVVINVARG